MNEERLTKTDIQYLLSKLPPAWTKEGSLDFVAEVKAKLREMEDTQ